MLFFHFRNLSMKMIHIPNEFSVAPDQSGQARNMAIVEAMIRISLTLISDSLCNIFIVIQAGVDRLRSIEIYSS